MGPILKEIGIAADRPLRSDEGNVENMSRVVCALLVRGLKKKIRTPDFWKILIQINFRDMSNEGKNLLGVLVCNNKFPSKEFVAWPVGRRQHYMLGFVSEAVRDIFRAYSLDISKLEEAVEYVIQSDFCNLIVGKKTFRAPNGIEIAHIECEQRMDEAKIYASFKKRGIPNSRILIATDIPEEFIFQKYFGQVVWDEFGRAVLLTTEKRLVLIDEG